MQLGTYPRLNARVLLPPPFLPLPLRPSAPQIDRFPFRYPLTWRTRLAHDNENGCLSVFPLASTKPRRSFGVKISRYGEIPHATSSRVIAAANAPSVSAPEARKQLSKGRIASSRGLRAGFESKSATMSTRDSRGSDCTTIVWLALRATRCFVSNFCQHSIIA